MKLGFGKTLKGKNRKSRVEEEECYSLQITLHGTGFPVGLVMEGREV